MEVASFGDATLDATAESSARSVRSANNSEPSAIGPSAAVELPKKARRDRDRIVGS
jgi:hypothetical protein